MELFPRDLPEATADAPLADRMRPRTLEQFVGQRHLLGPGGPLAKIVDRSGRLTSSILWGPPGSGKTTLARLLAAHARLRFSALSAVMSGIKELRAEIAAAEQQQQRGSQTVLFIDEIHRFNKAQQDALLPHVEQGVFVLLGATTENPSFEVIPALRSRARVLSLRPLSKDDLKQILAGALSDPRRGLGRHELVLDAAAEELLTRLAGGDARRALNLLGDAAERAEKRIGRADVEAVIDVKLPNYDKGGDQHYDVISAFIKSLRGSDPNAAVYWLARMLEGGEDPRFITRRMIIFASEDIGNACPDALSVAVAAAEAFDRVGLPEGQLILSQATLYLASVPKSNSATTAIRAARLAVQERGSLPVPLHLRNAPTELLRREGHGQGYRYPHNAPEHFVNEQYLPDELSKTRFYHASDQGEERTLAQRLRRLGQRPPEEN